MSAQVIFNYLTSMGRHNASDLYLTVGFKPTLRTDNGFVHLSDCQMSAEDIQAIIDTVLTNRQKREFETKSELNTSLSLGDHGRFRVNILQQRNSPALVIRRIVSKIPSFEELRLPKLIEKLSLEKRGFIMVTGMTGAGKSTTLAAMVDYRNRNSEGHIVTIEDPIEYYHEHQHCVVTQREVGVDTESFAVALKNALRQRPDVIMVGEVRDREVMEQALISAETGHLCLATIHTNNTYQTIDRVVNLFPDEYAKQIRLNLAMNLKALIAQRLVPTIDGGMVPAMEIMLNQGLIRELIMKGDIGRIVSVMEQNISNGMCTFDQSLIRLYSEGVITEDTAIANADKSGDLKIKLDKVKIARAQKGMPDLSSVIDTSLLTLRD